MGSIRIDEGFYRDRSVERALRAKDKKQWLVKRGINQFVAYHINRNVNILTQSVELISFFD
jgi:hypothetical protein